MAEMVRFELTKPKMTHAFQACAIDHYATPPGKKGLMKNIDQNIIIIVISL